MEHWHYRREVPVGPTGHIPEGQKMSAIAALRNGYPGDVAWQDLVDLYRPAWEQSSDRDLHRSLFGDEEIAIVVTGTLGPHSANWFGKPIGVLDMRAPVDVLNNEPSGLRIMRALLLRMPR
jgi:hypothetical protein